MCLRVAKRFQDTGVEVRIIGFPDQINVTGNSASQKSWVYDGVEICELRRGPLEDYLLRAVPYLKKRRATFPLARLFFEWAYTRQISKLCQGIQVFHYFGTGTEMIGYAVAMAARAVGAKLLVEPAIHEETWGDSWLDVPLYQVADLLIAHTGHEARLLENLGVRKETIQTIVHGVDFCDSGDGARFREKHRISGPMVLFLGRKTKEKGVERLLNAWPMVAEEFQDATLVFAGPKNAEFDELKNNLTTNHSNRHEKGNGDLTTEDTESTIEHRGRCEMEQPKVGPKGGGAGATETKDKIGLRSAGQAGPSEPDSPASELADALVSKSLTRFASNYASSLATSHPLPATALGPRVLNLDDLPEGEKQDALAACDVLCVPSEGESFGMVYYEAWAYKKPVVALDLPVLRESIGRVEGGLLTFSEPDSIGGALVRLLDDEGLRKEMGIRGFDLAKVHSWDKSLESYSLVYQGVGASI